MKQKEINNVIMLCLKNAKWMHNETRTVLEKSRR